MKNIIMHYFLSGTFCCNPICVCKTTHAANSRSHSELPNRSKPSTESLEVDWNRLVLGGWDGDTRRDTIQKEASDLLDTLQLKPQVEEVIVFGKRSSTCHVLLQKLPEQEARQRILTLQTQHRDKHTIPTSGNYVWLTAHKSPQLRFKNRITKKALQLIEMVTGRDSRDAIDCDWARQIIWVDDLRVASAHQSEIASPPDSHICRYVHYDPRLREEVPLFFNATNLVKSTGKTIEDIKGLLAQPESKGE